MKGKLTHDQTSVSSAKRSIVPCPSLFAHYLLSVMGGITKSLIRPSMNLVQKWLVFHFLSGSKIPQHMVLMQVLKCDANVEPSMTVQYVGSVHPVQTSAKECCRFLDESTHYFHRSEVPQEPQVQICGTEEEGWGPQRIQTITKMSLNLFLCGFAFCTVIYSCPIMVYNLTEMIWYLFCILLV